MDLKNHRRILCLDFDGVCHLYTSGWKGASVIPDAPVEGLFEFLKEAIIPFEVHIFSSRSNQAGGIQAMKNWFEFYADTPEKLATFRQLVFPEQKPPAFIGLDDRVITFSGVWPPIESLTNFVTWTQKEV